ncbi:MAG: DUF5132 domain-containing protein [Desulfomonilaceae bacterium]
MSIWDYTPKSGVWTGVAVGVGLVAAPVLIPLAWSGIETLLKAVLKGSFLVYEKAHELGAEIAEGAADMFEEAKSEVHSEFSVASKTVKAGKLTKSH